MKIYPEPINKKPEDEAGLGYTQKTTRKIAIAIAFASVFFFFVKLLFL